MLLLELLGSGVLYEQLTAEAANQVLARHDRAVRDLLERFEGREIEKTRRFLLLFERPLDAVGYSLAYHEAVAALGTELGRPLAARVGVHLGEVFLRENPPQDIALGAKPIELEGPSRTTVARLMSLATGGQTLLTKAAFDLARRAAVGAASLGGNLVWRAHGGYRFAGPGVTLDVFEVGTEGLAPLTAPDPTLPAEPLATRERTVAWIPTPGAPIPHHPNWMLTRPLEETYGEVWLGEHKKTGDRHTFRFCSDADELLRMRRQLAVVRHLKASLVDREVTVPALDAQLETPPFFLEFEHVEGKTLSAWSAEQEELGAQALANRLEIAARLAEVLAAVHAAGVAVGNVQPRTVLVRERRGSVEKVLVADLSRARLLDAKPGESSEALPAKPDDLVPEPYRAPELAESGVTPQTDVYALGILVYQLAVGDLDRSPGLFWERDVDDELLRADIAGLLEPEPSRRPKPDELARRLRTLDERAAAANRRTREATRRQWTLAAAAFALGALLVFVLLLLLPEGP